MDHSNTEKQQNKGPDVRVQYCSLDDNEVIYDYSLPLMGIASEQEYCKAPLCLAALELISKDPKEMHNLLNSSDEELKSVSPMFRLSAVREIFRKNERAATYAIQILQMYLSLCEENKSFLSENCFMLFLESISKTPPPFNTKYNLFGEYVSLRTAGTPRRDISRLFMLKELDGNAERTTEYFCAPSAEGNIITDICIASFIETLRRKRTFVKCAHCGKWFVPIDSREKYCDRESPVYPGKTCKEGGRYASEMYSRHTSETIRLLKNIRQKLDNSGKLEEKDILNERVRAWRAEIKAGLKTEAELIEWLKANYYVRKYGTERSGIDGKCD